MTHKHPECPDCPSWPRCKTGDYIGLKQNPLRSINAYALYQDCAGHMVAVDVINGYACIDRETGDYQRPPIPPRVQAVIDALDNELRNLASVPQEGTYGPVQCPRDARRAAGSGDGSAGNQLAGYTEQSK